MTFKPVAREVFSVSQLIMMIQCITRGAKKGGRFAKRNYYACDHSNDDWNDLVKRGFAEKFKMLAIDCFFLTDKGIEVVELIRGSSNG